MSRTRTINFGQLTPDGSGSSRRRRIDKKLKALYDGSHGSDHSMSPNPNSRKVKKMSKTETPETNIQKLTVKVKAVNLKTFAREVKEQEIDFVPAADYSQAVDRLGNDEAVLVQAINSILAARAVSAAKTKILGDDFVSLKTALSFIAPFRLSGEFAKMVTVDKGQPGWKEQYGKQTDALLKQVASNEFMLNAIRAAQATESEDSEDAE